MVLLFAHATLATSQFGQSSGSANPNLFDVGFVSKTTREDQVLLIVTIMLVVAGLTSIPARIGARRPVAEILQSGTA